MSNGRAKRGALLVLSAPSGAGKRTLLHRLRELEPNIETTISATTRMPRNGEEHGVDYYFLAEEAFRAKLAAGEFVEHAEVHGNLYGTLQSELERCLRAGRDIILELDVQGMRNLRRLRDDVTSVFLAPPSFEELERRLRHRGANDDDDIRLRLANAREEMAAQNEFDVVIVNDEVDRAAAALAQVLREARQRLQTVQE